MARPLDRGRLVVITSGPLQGVVARVVRRSYYTGDRYWVQVPQVLVDGRQITTMQLTKYNGPGRPVPALLITRGELLPTRTTFQTSKAFNRKFNTLRKSSVYGSASAS